MAGLRLTGSSIMRSIRKHPIVKRNPSVLARRQKTHPPSISIGWVNCIVVLVIVALAPFAATGGDALEEILQHVPPIDAAESLKTFKTMPGLKVELVAAEPNVADPADITFDEKGRMYLCELWNYPGVPKPGERLGRVRLLESTRGDGIYDKSTVFAENLRWPGGVICWDGGVFVASAPDVWYLKDTKGTGHADVREKVFTGMSGGTYEIANSLRWGLDNKIYISGSYAGGELVPVAGGQAGQRSRDFRFDPRTRVVEAVSGGGEFGQSFDDFGERYTCDATHLLWHPILPLDELAQNPFLAISTVQEMSIPQWTHIYPISSPEPWKAAREKFWSRWVDSNSDMRAGRFPKTELAPHGYATAACGIAIYRGSALGPEYDGDAFVAEPANNVVVRLKLRNDGVTVKAQRPQEDEQQQREFLASTDIRFRPVNLANGPDGCLYVAAMYREIIEDESAIPNDILKHYDLFTGRDRGRILRIAPDNFTRPSLPTLDQAGIDDLVAALGHKDAWYRETAQRLIYQKQDKRAIEPLRNLARSGALPQTRIAALWALKGLASLDESAIAIALADTNARVREHAVRLSEDLLRDSPELGKKLMALAGDAEIRVRFRVAFALARVTNRGAVEALASIAARNAGDPWVRAAVLSAAGERSGALMTRLLADTAFLNSTNARSFFGELAQIAGGRRNKAEIADVLTAMSHPAMKTRLDWPQTVIRQLGDGLARAGTSLRDELTSLNGSSAIDNLFAQAAGMALDSKLNERDRIDALGLLAYAPYSTAEKPLTSLLNPNEPTAVQIGAIRALSAQTDPNVGTQLVARWRAFGPAVRPDVIDALFRKKDRLTAVFDAIERGTMSANDLEPRRRTSLIKNADSAIAQRARKVLSAPARTDKETIIARYREEILKLSGNPRRGEAVFKAVCAQCHQPDQGVRVGPNLATLDNRGPDVLLIAIIDPNRDVKPNFIDYEISTKAGDEFSGVIANETATSVTLARAGGGQEVILRSNISTMRSAGISLMPEGLESGINYQQMADLIQFLQAFK